jgi:FtsH-binding integral membrane protein
VCCPGAISRTGADYRYQGNPVVRIHPSTGRTGSRTARKPGHAKEREIMTETVVYQPTAAATRDQVHTLFAQTMGYVAVTSALFALGAYLGRHLVGGVGIVAFVAAFACLIGMRFAARSSPQLTMALLGAFGLLIGLAVAPTIAYYASADPRALWEAGGATALFIAGFGAAGYATRRDLAAVARVSSWALLALIVFGIVAIFVTVPHSSSSKYSPPGKKTKSSASP